MLLSWASRLTLERDGGVGDYRVICALREEVLLVLIVKAGHRRDVYRGLPG